MVTAETLNRQGIEYSRKKKYGKAMLAFTTALEIEPANPQIIYNMALVFIKKEDWSTAKELLEKAILLNEDEADYNNDLGLCLYKMGDREGALAEYELTLKKEPTHAVVWNNRGVIFFQDKDYLSAEECFRTSVSLNPDWEDSWFNLRDTYEMLGEREKWKEAHKRYQSLKKRGPKNS